MPCGGFPRPAHWNLTLGSFLDGLPASTTSRGALRRRFANQLGAPDGSDEFLGSVIVEINRRAVVIGLGHNSQPVLVMANGLALN
jgi:hypothetical protein